MTCATPASDVRSNASESVFAYVRYEQAADFLRTGWLPHPSLQGTNHGNYAVLMEWPCKCPIPFPR